MQSLLNLIQCLFHKLSRTPCSYEPLGVWECLKLCFTSFFYLYFLLYQSNNSSDFIFLMHFVFVVITHLLWHATSTHLYLHYQDFIIFHHHFPLFFIQFPSFAWYLLTGCISSSEHLIVLHSCTLLSSFLWGCANQLKRSLITGASFS